MKQFFIKSWYYFIMIAMIIVIVKLYYKPATTIVVEDTKAIERLRFTVDSLTNAHLAFQEDIANQQAVLIENITKQNKKYAKKINDIPKLSDPERDNIWSDLNTSEDSLPGRYWDILEQKTGK